MTSGNISRSLGLSALAIMSVAGLALSGAGAARADIDPTTQAATLNTLGNGDTLFTWNVAVTNTESVVTNDYFTIYDFAGFVYNPSNLTGGFAVPAGWVESYGFSTPNVTASYNSAGPNYNDPTIPDVTFTYKGLATLTGPQSLGNFTLESIYGGAGSTTVEAFAALAEQNGQIPYSNANATQIIGPNSSTTPGHGNPVSPTPEPGVFVTAGSMLGMTGLGLVRGRRRAKGAKVAA